MIILKKSKLDFKKMFKDFLVEYKKRTTSYASPYGLYDGTPFYDDPYYDEYGYWDDYYNDWSGSYSGFTNYGTKGYNRKSVRNSTNKLVNGYYSEYEKNKQNKSKVKKHQVAANAADDYILITFYENMEDISSGVSTFHDLASFDEFLTEKGIKVSDKTIDTILAESTIHCCAVAEDEDNPNKLELLCENSFGGLHWLWVEHMEKIKKTSKHHTYAN